MLLRWIEDLSQKISYHFQKYMINLREGVKYMTKLWQSYKSTIILLLSILLGGIIGVIIGPDAQVLEPFGQIFLNLMFVIIVPLVFFSVTSAIANMSEMKRLGKILINILVIFLSTALIAGIISVIGAFIFNPTAGLDSEAIKNILAMSDEEAVNSTQLSLAQTLVNTFTVGDFSALLTKSNMLQLIVFSVLFGIATALVGEKATVVKEFLSGTSDILMKIVKIIMYYAPFGLGCYFASVVGQLGTQILEGYLKAFLLYLGVSLIYYFIFYSIYAYIAAGKQGIKAFWKNIIPPTVTSLATCSSAASIPVNLESTKKIGVPDDIAETVIPLGVNTHKDGSVIGGVIKIVFLFGLFGRDYKDIGSILSILAVGFLVGAVMGAIPGGGMIGEMLILSVYGFSPELLPIIAVIGTIIDAPATVLNSTSNTACSMLVSRFVDGKKWLKDSKTN